MYLLLVLDPPASVSEFRPVHHDLHGYGDADPAELVPAAVAGDQAAWEEIVRRYTRLLLAVLRPYRLTSGETEDVAQTVWLRVVERLVDLREPRALPQWIITTARREAIHVAARAARMEPTDPQDPAWLSRLVSPDEAAEELVRNERHLALLEGFASLNPRQRQLMVLLSQDPPVPYAEISRLTGIPPGAIGPTRARALERLREAPSVQALHGGSDGPRGGHND